MRRPFGFLLAAFIVTASARAASVDGIDIHSVSAGSGPTIVFVHGWTCDTSSWREQMPAFDDNYRVIALDLPGHGQSGSPADGQFSMELFARAVEAVREEAGADQIVLVGHSMGAPVIRRYAIDFPEHVAGLVAVDGSLDIRGIGRGRAGGGGGGGGAFTMTAAMRENMIRGMFVPETPAELQQHILDMMLGTSEATATGAIAAMSNPGAGADAVTPAPALAVIAGTNALPNVETMRAIVPEFEAVQVPGTGHFLMMEKPAEFNRILADFLEQIDF